MTLMVKSSIPALMYLKIFDVVCYVVLCSSVGRAWRFQRQDSGFDSWDHPYVKNNNVCTHDNESLWIKASSK